MNVHKNNMTTKTIILVSLLCISLIPITLINTVSADWWNTSWSYRKQLTINHTKVVADLTNFPLLVDATDTDLAAKAQPEGGDIAFISADGTKLNHEIELFNHTIGKLVVWVNMPSISSTVDTTFYMYYGNPTAPNQQAVAAVWDSNYKLVQHLEESSGTEYDSTIYGNNGFYNGTKQDIAGKINGADGFVGNFGAQAMGDYIDCGNDSSLDISDAITVSAWIKPDDQTQWNHICSKGNGEWNVDANRVYQFAIQPDETIDFIVNSNQTYKAITTQKVLIGQWSYVVATYDRNYMRIYINGIENASLAYTEPIQTSSVNLRIASRVYGTGNTGPQGYTFDGDVDEVRVSSAARSPSWVSTEFNNQADPTGFCTLGIEEVVTIVLSVNPATLEVNLGQEFSVDIDLSFISNLYGFQLYLSFNNTILEALNIQYEGFLNEPTHTFYQSVDNIAGCVALGVSSLYPAESKTGNSPPPLATVTFRAIGVGQSSLHLYDTILVDSQLADITHVRSDGSVQIVAARDIALTEVNTTKKGCVPLPTLCQGCTTNITVRIENQGDFTETINLTAYVTGPGGTTKVGERVAAIGVGETVFLRIVWNSSGFAKGNYIVWAEASPVPGETDTADNSLAGESVTVVMMGDVNADMVVDIFDIVRGALAFGSTPKDLNWDPNADINDDGLIDIFDIVAVAINFGKIDP